MKKKTVTNTLLDLLGVSKHRYRLFINLKICKTVKVVHLNHKLRWYVITGEVNRWIN